MMSFAGPRAASWPTALGAVLALLLLAARAAACDVCDDSREVFTTATATVVTDGACTCEFLFVYSDGDTNGKVRVAQTEKPVPFAVYGSVDAGALPLSELPDATEATVYSHTGILRVVFEQPPLDGAVTLASTAINDPPIIYTNPHPNVLVYLDAGFELQYIAAGIINPLPVFTRDDDNHGGGVTVELAVISFLSDPPTTALWATIQPPGVTFEVGSVGTPVHQIIMSGTSEAVEAALSTIYLYPQTVSTSDNIFTLIASDQGNSGEGGINISAYTQDLAVFPLGHYEVTAASQQVNSGRHILPDILQASWHVRDAARITFTEIGLESSFIGECYDFVRVYDGVDAETGELLSTDIAPTGELCSQTNRILEPTYISFSGSFFVELFTDESGTSDGFHTVAEPVPDGGFHVWLLDGDAQLQAAGPVVLPQIMIASLPADASEVTVHANATHGDVSLQFADSFVDVIAPSAPGTVTLVHANELRSPLLRLGAPLRELVYTPRADYSGSDVIVISAHTADADAQPLLINVEVVAVSVNVPEAIEINAFRPVLLGVTTTAPALVVTAESGIGRISVDPRAMTWVDIGYASTLTVTAAEAPQLTYYGDLGGTDIITLQPVGGGAATRMEITVDPRCDGTHNLYARSGTFTERAGPDSDPYFPGHVCEFYITGANELYFPFWGLNRNSILTVLDGLGNLLYTNVFRPTPPSVLRSPLGFIVLYEALSFGGEGFRGSFALVSDIEYPPVVAVPDAPMFVVIGSRTRLDNMWANPFTDVPFHVSVTTDIGLLQPEGASDAVQNVVFEGTFAEVDTFLTSIDFIADVQGAATITLQATTSDLSGGLDSSFVIGVLPCLGRSSLTIPEDNAADSLVVSDGSGIADYPGNLNCEWRLTGAPAPAVLDLEFLDTECFYDEFTVYDGASKAGRLLGTFCSLGEVEEHGALVAASGSFFITLTSDNDIHDNGFSAVYHGLANEARTSLGAIPEQYDPQRTDAALVELTPGGSLVLLGGWNGIRPSNIPLLYSRSAGTWFRIIVNERLSLYRGAVAALTDSVIVMHGGFDSFQEPTRSTYVGVLSDLDTTQPALDWTLVASDGPLLPASKAHVHAGVLHLLGPDALWVLDDAEWTWSQLAPTGAPGADVVPTASTYDGGRILAPTEDGAVYSLDLATLRWTAMAARIEAPCTLACALAMLGTEELVVIPDDPAQSQRFNMTAGESTGRAFSVGEGGVPISTTFSGKPALLLYGQGEMSVIAAVMAVDGAFPQVSPTAGGTVVDIAGEQLSECVEAQCLFGDAAPAPAAVVTARHARCTTTAWSTGSVAVRLMCADGRQYQAPAPLHFFSDPEIVSVEPERPAAGDAVLVSLGGVEEAVLEAAGEGAKCRFDEQVVDAQIDGEALRCRVPDDVAPAATVSLRVALDGQQFGEASAAIDIKAGGGGDSAVVLVASIAAAVVALMAIALVWVRKTRRVAEGPEKWEIPFEAIELGKSIGEGAFGSVYRGLFRGGEVAVKVTRGEVSAETIDAFRKESALMAELRHPNIVLFMGACTVPPNIAIVLEFLARGSLFDLLHNETVVIKASHMWSFGADIAKGMAYLHAADPPIIHRDLKSLNVLVDKSWTMKVSDFGLTEMFSDKQNVSKKDKVGSGQSTEGGAVGSVQWMAPEVLSSGTADFASMESDVYAFGITLWEIASRQIPYEGVPLMAIASRVSASVGFRPVASNPIPDEIMRIIEECWAHNAVARPTFADLRTTFEQMSVAEPADLHSILSSAITVPDDPWAVTLHVVGEGDLWERDPEGTRDALSAYLQIVDETLQRIRGIRGESGACLFSSAQDAVRFALSVQQSVSVIPLAMAIGSGSERDEAAVADAANGQIRLNKADAQKLELASLDALLIDQGELGYLVFAKDSVGAGPGTLSEGPQGAADPGWLIPGEDLEIGERIGSGTYGTVFKAMWHGSAVACKRLHRKKLAQTEALDLQMEVGLVTRLRHPNVCLFLGVSRDADSAGRVFVVSEYMSKGSVFDAVVNARKEISRKIKTKIARDVALGLQYLHEQQPPVLHRALSSRNVLLGDGWTVKVSDFAMARTKDSQATMTKLGSSTYTAPEILRNERYSEKADVYAYGILVWEVVRQEVAFRGLRIGTLMNNVLAGTRPTPDAQILQPVIAQCWAADPEDRPKIGDVAADLQK